MGFPVHKKLVKQYDFPNTAHVQFFLGKSHPNNVYFAPKVYSVGTLVDAS